MKVRLSVGKIGHVFANEEDTYTYIKAWCRELDITPLDFISLLVSGEVKLKRLSK